LSHTSTVSMVYSKAIHDVKQKMTAFFIGPFLRRKDA